MERASIEATTAQNRLHGAPEATATMVFDGSIGVDDYHGMSVTVPQKRPRKVKDAEKTGKKRNQSVCIVHFYEKTDVCYNTLEEDHS